MARALDDKGGASRLVAVKSVSAAYPLRGSLQLKAGPDAPTQTVYGYVPIEVVEKLIDSHGGIAS